MNNKAALPVELQPVLDNVLERVQANDDWADLIGRDPELGGSLQRVLVCSDYAADILARYPFLLEQLIDSGRMHRALSEAELDEVFRGETPDDETEAQFMRRLRLFRHRELLRVIWRNLCNWADCDDTLRELSAVADVCLRSALLRSSQELQRRHGNPLDEAGSPVEFVIVAMGKLGGGELNFSSDVDLVFLYSDRGETDGPRPLANEEYFRRLCQHFIKMLSSKTADGFVYRVDARLRPFGDSGPLAVSVDAFENYLLQHGRDWERYAWVKARVVNAWSDAASFYKDILRPFVYRRYLDFGVFSSLREMKSMIEKEGRAAANRENVKLGLGGIREIEFIVQTLQLVRGGTDRQLRERSLMPALRKLGEVGLMQPEVVSELTSAYRFLRQLENRLQMIADRQTHELPTEEVDRARLYYAMGESDWDALYARLNGHRDVVQNDFDEILRHEREADESDSERPPDQSLNGLIEACFADPDEVHQRLQTMRSGSQYTRMDEVSRQRLDRLIPEVIRASASAGHALRALDGTLRVIQAIGRRSAYIALLNENVVALERLVNVCGSSDFLARQVAAHPLLLDEMLDQRIFMEAPTRADFESDLRQRMEGVTLDDTEQRFEAIRNFQQAAVFRVAVADLSGTLPLMQVSDRLTDIAELVLAQALELGMAELTARHGQPHCRVNGESHRAGFAIAGYGKLGGLELGYGSDLDIVFMHDSEGEAQQTDGDKPLDNAMFFGRLARRVTHILTMPTPTGALYEVDTRLRPSGNSGLLVTSLKALDTYQQNEAWTWEHQALLRARAVAGDAKVCERFETLRQHALLDYVKRDTLAAEVIKMRKRMRSELDKSDALAFDIKQGSGGVIDLEFLVQYLVLSHAPDNRALLCWSDNIRQLEALGEEGILSATDAGALADAYRGYRVRMHLLSLAGEPRLAGADEFETERALVAEIWQRYLGAAD